MLDGEDEPAAGGCLSMISLTIAAPAASRFELGSSRAESAGRRPASRRARDAAAAPQRDRAQADERRAQPYRGQSAGDVVYPPKTAFQKEVFLDGQPPA
jgi:hypothetical protein